MRKTFLVAGMVVFSLALLATSSYSAKPDGSVPRTVVVSQNPELDFILVNKTGYAIKAVYIGKSGTGDWAKEDEILKGRPFPNGKEYSVEFKPKETAEKWDLMVTWADGDGSVEWLNLNLTKIDKVTLHYDKAKDKTWADIE